MKLAVLNPELELAMEDISIKQVKSLSRPSRSKLLLFKNFNIIIFFSFVMKFQFQAYFTNLPVVVASKPSIMIDAPLFPLDQQGSLDLSVINPNQATSIEAVRTFINLKTSLSSGYFPEK